MLPGKGPSRVAFLRGINVGGSGLLKMQDLRALAKTLGFEDPTTLGASGNLLYRSDATPKADTKRLEDALTKKMGKAAVVVRTAPDMSKLVEGAPYRRPHPTVPDKWRFIALLAAPSKKPLPEILPGTPIEIVGRSAREVFYMILAPSSAAIGMAARLEKALGVSMTVRNWNVVRTIAATLNPND